MPVSKRDKKVSLTKTKKKGLKTKETIIETIREKIDEFERIFVFSVDNMRNAPLKEVRDKWKDSRFVFAKKTLMKQAIKDQSPVMPNLAKLEKCLIGQCGLFFTNQSKKYVQSWFEEYSTMEYARSGFVATETVTIPAGPLPDLQSTMEPVLRKLGLPTKLNKGIIVLREDHVVCTKGVRLTPEQATVLRHLGKPMSEFKIALHCMWSKDGTFQKFENLNKLSRLEKPMEPNSTHEKKKSKKKNKKQPKAKRENDSSEIKYAGETHMKDNDSEDGEEGIVEDHSENEEKENSDKHQSEDERMDEDEEMDEDEGMHEDDEMQEDEGEDLDDGMDDDSNSDDMSEENRIKSPSPQEELQEKSPPRKNTNHKRSKTSAKKISHNEQIYELKNVQITDSIISPSKKTLSDLKTPKTPIQSPQKISTSGLNKTSPKIKTPKQNKEIDVQSESSQETKSSSQEIESNSQMTISSPKAKTPKQKKEIDVQSESSQKTNSSSQENESNSQRTISSPKAKTPKQNKEIDVQSESSQETNSSSQENESNSQITISSPKAKTPKQNKNFVVESECSQEANSSSQDNESHSSDSQKELIDSSEISQETMSQESSSLSEENKTSKEDSESTIKIEEHSKTKVKPRVTRKRKDSNQSQPSPQKMNPDEENKTEVVGASNPSPKITRSNPRRSLRTPKPIKRTPPNETKQSENHAVTGSATKRLRRTPLKGTPQKSQDTPTKRTTRRKSIFPETVAEDVEMK